MHKNELNDLDIDDKALLHYLSDEYACFLTFQRHPLMLNIYSDRLQQESFASQVSVQNIIHFINAIPTLKNNWQDMGFSSDRIPNKKNKNALEELRKTLIRGTSVMLQRLIYQERSTEPFAANADHSSHAYKTNKTVSNRFFFNQVAERIHNTTSFFGDSNRPIRK